VKALGEPLVVVRRSALNDVLAGALASGTVHNGVTAKEIELTSDAARITLSDSTTRARSVCWRTAGSRGAGGALRSALVETVSVSLAVLLFSLVSATWLPSVHRRRTTLSVGSMFFVGMEVLLWKKPP
jgi:hypothetical protein